MSKTTAEKNIPMDTLPVSFFSLLRVVLCLAPRWEGGREEAVEAVEAALGPGGVLGVPGLSLVSRESEVSLPAASTDTRDLASGLGWSVSPAPASTLSQEVTLFSFSAGPGASSSCFSGLQIVLEAVEDSTSSQSYCPLRGRPESKSKFHRLEASLRAFFSSFLTKRRFSSWSVGPNRARLTLAAPEEAGGGPSSSELLWDSLRRLEWTPNILGPGGVKDWWCIQVPVMFKSLNSITRISKSTADFKWKSSVHVLSNVDWLQMSNWLQEVSVIEFLSSSYLGRAKTHNHIWLSGANFKIDRIYLLSN